MGNVGGLGEKVNTSLMAVAQIKGNSRHLAKHKDWKQEAGGHSAWLCPNVTKSAYKYH